jgi:endonuclease YncB( thermonuclease family)
MLMGHSIETLREIEKRIDNALERPNLDKWSRTFLRDMRVRIAKYGKNVRFSEKQAKTLSRLIDFEVSADLAAPSPWGRSRRSGASVQASRRLARGGIRVAVLAVLFGFVCAGAAYGTLTYLRPTYEPLDRLNVRVIDGDTISIAGVPQNVRLVGFNAPETSEPQCSLEGGLGKAATDKLKQLVAADDLDFAYVRCACPLGTAGTSDCNFGRACGSLRVGGEDVGEILVAEGLAVPFACGWTSCPSLPRPWCGEVATPASAPVPLVGGGQTSGNCVIKGNVSITAASASTMYPIRNFTTRLAFNRNMANDGFALRQRRGPPDGGKHVDSQAAVLTPRLPNERTRTEAAIPGRRACGKSA